MERFNMDESLDEPQEAYLEKLEVDKVEEFQEKFVEKSWINPFEILPEMNDEILLKMLGGVSLEDSRKVNIQFLPNFRSRIL